MAQNNFIQTIRPKHLVVLFITLLVLPLLWGTGVFKIPASTIFPWLDRPSFWTFFLTILFIEWLAFFLIYQTTKPKMAEYLSINKDFLQNHRILLIGITISLIVLAGVSPLYLYGDTYPVNSLLGSIGPVSSLERIAFLLLSLTAGICEEVIFRGYGISVLERLFKRKSIALVISSAAFMSLHGIGFLPWQLMFQYFVIGLIFGYFFQKFRRLEILMIVHFLIDALVAIAIP